MKLALPDIAALRDQAVAEFQSIPIRGRLPGMHRPCTDDELRAVSWFRSTLALLKRHGALAPDFVDQTEFRTPDSDTEE